MHYSLFREMQGWHVRDLALRFGILPKSGENSLVGTYLLPQDPFDASTVRPLSPRSPPLKAFPGRIAFTFKKRTTYYARIMADAVQNGHGPRARTFGLGKTIYRGRRDGICANRLNVALRPL